MSIIRFPSLSGSSPGSIILSSRNVHGSPILTETSISPAISDPNGN